MTRKSATWIIGLLSGLVILASSITLWYLLAGSSTTKKLNKPSPSASAQDDRISLNEVEKHTGKGGNSCWVVIDDAAYEISGFALWADGVHSPSGGRARCGKDLTEVIDQSPHGKSKLKLLKEVGTFRR